MNQKEKYRAEIDAKLVTFGETLHEIKTRKEKRKENWPGLQIKATEHKHQVAAAKLQELKQSDNNTWAMLKSEVDDLVKDIDKELREALAYFD